MKWSPFSSPPLIGLDIQPHEMRLVQLRKTRKSFLVEQAAVVQLPDGVFSEGKIRNWETVRQLLAEAVQQFKFAGMTAALALPASLVRMQHIQIPAGLPENAIEDEIKVQLEKDFPGFSGSLFIDFRVTAFENSGYSDVFFMAARREYIAQCVDCINSAGLHTKIVDIDIYALKRVFDFNLSSENTINETSALVCYINHAVTFIIFAANEILFHHQWDVASDNEFLSQLKSRIQLFFAAFPASIIRRLAVYSSHQHIETLLRQAEFQEFDIHHPNPFHSIINNQIDLANISGFLVACGSAMREVPGW